MGGGGFTMEPENPALDDYVLSLAGAKVPRICLLPTASGDGEAPKPKKPRNRKHGRPR